MTRLKNNRRFKVATMADVTPSCIGLHLDPTKAVREHDCQLAKPESATVDCKLCKRHRAPRAKGVCWWCEQVMKDSTLMKLEDLK